MAILALPKFLLYLYNYVCVVQKWNTLLVKHARIIHLRSSVCHDDIIFEHFLMKRLYPNKAIPK